MSTLLSVLAAHEYDRRLRYRFLELGLTVRGIGASISVYPVKGELNLTVL